MGEGLREISPSPLAGGNKKYFLPITDRRTPIRYNTDMSTAFTNTIPTDPIYKHAYCYGVLSSCMSIVREVVERAKREGSKIDPDDVELQFVIKMFETTDDALHAEKKND